jgi:hypothetical protein
MRSYFTDADRKLIRLAIDAANADEVSYSSNSLTGQKPSQWIRLVAISITYYQYSSACTMFRRYMKNDYAYGLAVKSSRQQCLRTLDSYVRDYPTFLEITNGI